MLIITDPLARAHVASLRLPEYSGASSTDYFLYVLPLIVLTCALLRWRPLAGPPRTKFEEDKGRRLLKLAGLAFAGLVLVIVAHPSSAGRADGRLRVDFLDVGQGDSALVTMPDGATLLVDGGGRPDRKSTRPN